MIKILVVLLMALVVMAGTFVHIDAVPYEKQADSNYVKEKIVKPYTGKSGWWIYIIKVCASDHSLGIAEVILSSDMETRYLGVGKSIAKNDCSTYGAVMKAKNGSTLGYKMTTTSEAAEKIIASKQGKRNSTDWPEVNRYKFILGYY